MSRIRYLKPDFFKDEDIAELDFEARLLFAGLWVIADKSGRLEYRPKRIKAEIFPYENINIEKHITKLNQPKIGSGRPFIQIYKIDNQEYIQILNWDKHQKPHHTEKESIIPPYNPENSIKNFGDMEKGMGMGMEKGMGMENQLEASMKLSNGDLTVKKPLKVKYLDKVLLTEEEYQKLCERFTKEGADLRIKNLNQYGLTKEKKFKEYSSHYHVILKWEEDKDNNGKNKEEIDKYAGQTKQL